MTTRASTPSAARAWATCTTFVREFDVQHQIKLEQNYRSHGNILDCANALIEQQQPAAWARTCAPTRARASRCAFTKRRTDLDEAQLDGRGNPGSWCADDGFQRQEIAVLYRSNAQSRVIEAALFNAGMPYRVYGGLRFFERAEIKHALAYLRLLENPHDDTSFLRVVNFPARGIGARSIEALQEAARARPAAACSDAVTPVQRRGRGQAARLSSP